MKKQIELKGVVIIVETTEDILAMNLTINEMVAIYNKTVPAENGVKKFTDKATGAKRLLAVLPEYVIADDAPIHFASAKGAKFACGSDLGKFSLNKDAVTCPNCKAALAAAKPVKASARDNSVKSILRRLYAHTDAAYKLEELLTLTSAPYKVLMDDIARLKNAKYAGKAGVLVIVKNGDFYCNKADLQTTVEEPSCSPAGEAC